MRNNLLLYFDDTGHHSLNRSEGLLRNDRMDCFGLGGVLMETRDVNFLITTHKAFCDRWEIDYPLHSYSIRGQRGRFTWLRNFKFQAEFYSSLQKFLTNIPVLGIAAIIHRPGYFERYMDLYKQKTWTLDKTALVILVERSVKFAMQQNKKIELYVEEAGKKEEQALMKYVHRLKLRGMPFSGISQKDYESLGNYILFDTKTRKRGHTDRALSGESLPYLRSNREIIRKCLR